MNKIKRYTKEEALKIINADEELKKELEEYKSLDPEDLDYGFAHGNFFYLYDDDTDTLTDKVVIQWLPESYDDLLNIDFQAHEVIADSLEEAVVILRDIEEAHGNIEA